MIDRSEVNLVCFVCLLFSIQKVEAGGAQNRETPSRVHWKKTSPVKN